MKDISYPATSLIPTPPIQHFPTQTLKGSPGMLLSGLSSSTFIKRSLCCVSGRCWSQWMSLLVFCLVSFGFSNVSQAQHCGRVGYMPEWNQSLMSWEGTGTVAPVGPTSDAWRLKGVACEGPLCRSQSPVPFSQHESSQFPVSPMPWVCTALATNGDDDQNLLWVLTTQESTPLNPVLDSLFKPPRSV